MRPGASAEPGRGPSSGASMINVFGETAIATFNGHFVGRIKGNPVELDQQGTILFVQVGGDWKVVHEHFSLIGPPPMPRS